MGGLSLPPPSPAGHGIAVTPNQIARARVHGVYTVLVPARSKTGCGAGTCRPGSRVGRGRCGQDGAPHCFTRSGSAAAASEPPQPPSERSSGHTDVAATAADGGGCLRLVACRRSVCGTRPRAAHDFLAQRRPGGRLYRARAGRWTGRHAGPRLPSRDRLRRRGVPNGDPGPRHLVGWIGQVSSARRAGGAALVLPGVCTLS